MSARARSAPSALGGRPVASRGSLQGVDAWTELGRDPPPRSPFPALIYGNTGAGGSPILPIPTPPDADPMHVEQFH